MNPVGKGYWCARRLQPHVDKQRDAMTEMQSDKDLAALSAWFYTDLNMKTTVQMLDC